jgi:CDGSH-type Zn-finger protein
VDRLRSEFILDHPADSRVDLAAESVVCRLGSYNRLPYCHGVGGGLTATPSRIVRS